MTAATDPFLDAAIAEAEAGRDEGGIPIGAVLVHRGTIIGRGHNRRVQQGSTVLHGEMDALERAGRLPASVYRECTIYTTLSPCPMCSGAILLYGIPRVVVGENRTFMGDEALLRERGVEVTVLDLQDLKPLAHLVFGHASAALKDCRSNHPLPCGRALFRTSCRRAQSPRRGAFRLIL